MRKIIFGGISLLSLLVAQAQAYDCFELPSWDAAEVYWGGDRVEHLDSAYEANWWTQGKAPDQYSGAYQEWSLLGSCDGGAANQAPQVSLDSPTADAILSENDSVAISANASDADGSVARVDFLLDGALLESDSTAPYATSWQAQAGSHTLSAVAVDDEGATGSSGTVSISVTATTPPPPPPAGAGLLRSVYNTSLCLDAGNYAGGAEITLQNCDEGSQQQLWQFDSQGRVALVENGSYCLSASELDYFGNPQMATCDASAEQQWQHLDGALRNGDWALDIDVANTDVIVYGYHGGNNQLWDFVEVTPQLGGVQLISSYDQSLCLTAAAESGAVAGTDACDQEDSLQRWRQEVDGSVSAEADRNLCLEAGALQSLAEITLEACDGGDRQTWNYSGQLLRQGDYAVDLHVNSGDVSMYALHGGSNQQWLGFEEQGGGGTEECPAGSVITALTPDAGVARMGTVFSSTLYDPTDDSQNNDSHNPQQIAIRVTNGGAPVSDCEVDWQVSGGAPGGGWVFPDSRITDSDGEISAWWTAGSASQQMVVTSITTGGGGQSSASISGSAYPHSTRSNSIHINWSSGTWDKFSVDVTPLTFPATTYYSAINFPGGYTGIQSHQAIFSVWDVGGVDAEIIDVGASSCTGFGGEGTGAKCEYALTPVAGNTYRFEVEASYPVANRTDYTGYMTDVASDERIKLATIRYGSRQYPSGAAGFVEDWWEAGSSCLAANARTAYFHNVRYQRDGGSWSEIKSARFSAVYNQWHNEICANYYFGAEDGKFKWSSGGDELVGPPINVPNNNPDFSTTVTLP